MKRERLERPRLVVDDGRPIKHVIPPHIAELLGPPPLLKGESVKSYRAMLTTFAEDVNPKTFLEWSWVKDLTDHTWQIRRLRCLAVRIVETDIPEVIHKFVAENLGLAADDQDFPDEHMVLAKVLIREAQGGDARARARIEPILKTMGLDYDSITAASFSANLEKIMQIEQLIAGLERRRNSLYVELDRYRFGLGEKLRTKAEAESLDTHRKAISEHRS